MNDVAWIEKWRLDRYNTMKPEKVRVLPVSNDYVIVEGEDHTSYAGGFFDTPDAAFAHVLKDAERSIRYGNELKERVLRAQQRFNEKGD